MNIPFLSLNRSARTRSPGAFEPKLQHVLSRQTRCKLLTRIGPGRRNTLTLRLFDWSLGATPNLWFLIRKRGHVAIDVKRNAEVSIEIVDPNARDPIRIDGRAQLVEGRHQPVYLHPSVRSALVKIATDPLDFAFLRVELRPDSA